MCEPMKIERKIIVELEAINSLSKELYVKHFSQFELPDLFRNERSQRILLMTENFLSNKQKEDLNSLNVWRELFMSFPSEEVDSVSETT
jgi:hypothetical protein